MQIKHFQAATMAEALERVKRELGPEAVILSACSCKNGKGLLDSFKKAGVEVTAAGNGPLAPSGANRSRTDAQKVTINRGSYPAAARRLARPKMIATCPTAHPMRPCDPRSNECPRTGSTSPRRRTGRRIQSSPALSVSAETRGRKSLRPGDCRRGLPVRRHRRPETRKCVAPAGRHLEKMGVAAQPPVFKSGQQRCIAVVGATGVGKAKQFRNWRQNTPWMATCALP